jgi:nicotinate-nucleotide--dimethylbenzimidazole phosphoribosyltransferase
MKQYMKTFNIQPVSKELEKKLQHKIDNKTKPLGALGQLEKIAVQIGLIQHTLSPELKHPHIIVFAADHGITNEGVSAYPQEVTFQMVMNFLNGGAAINVFCKQNDIAIKVVDAGVNYEFPPALDKIIDSKIAMGTKSFLDGPAMSEEEVRECINRGATLVTEIAEKGCNVIGFGEMGIGNTTSASALMHLICKIPVKECVGKGTGLDDKGLQKKTNILRIALANNEGMDGPLNILATFGGFEIAQICGAMLQAAENKMLILVDGFISSAAFLVAHAMHPAIMEYAIFCHQSDEQGHAKMLNHLNVKSLLNLNLRLGEGTGVAMAYPLIQAAVHFINEMASFESAGVSNKE